MAKPEVPSDVLETKSCDVLVNGLGISGIVAARAASEAGAKVIGIEKQAQIGTIGLSGDFGIYGSKKMCIRDRRNAYGYACPQR